MKGPPERRPAEAGGLLGRWARRKSALRRGATLTDETPPAAPEPPVAAPVPDGPALVDETAAAEVEPLLPPLDTLNYDSDYSAFMSPKVDPALRGAALRKLFHSPEFNVTDGLDDYCDDFTFYEPLGDMITSDMRHQMKVAAERKGREEGEAALQADEEPALAVAREDPAESALSGGDTAPEAVSAELSVAASTSTDRTAPSSTGAEGREPASRGDQRRG